MSALVADSRASLSPLALYPRYSELVGRGNGPQALCRRYGEGFVRREREERRERFEDRRERFEDRRERRERFEDRRDRRERFEDRRY